MRRLLIQIVALLVPPTLLVVWLLCKCGVRAIASWSTDFSGNLFAANTLVMMLIWLGHLMILINLCFYIHHVWVEAFASKGARSPGQGHLKAVLGAAFVIALVIMAFVLISIMAFAGVRIPRVSVDWVIEVNHYVLLGIFVCFVMMDGLALRRARLHGNGAAADATASLLAIWLVSVPSILVTLFALLLHNVLLGNAEWMLIMDKPELLTGARYGYLHVPLVNPSADERPLFGLFVSGLNVGLLMASIIASQVAFFVLEVFRQRAEASPMKAGQGSGHPTPA